MFRATKTKKAHELWVKSADGTELAFDPGAVDAKITAKEIDARRSIFKVPEPPKWLDLHDNRMGVLGRQELREMRLRMLELQSETCGAEQLRAMRMVDLVDRALEVIERQIAIEVGVDAVSDLSDAMTTLTDDVGDAIKFSHNAVADVLQDNPAATPAEIASLLGDLFAEKVDEMKKETIAAVEVMGKKIEAAIDATKGLSEVEE
jgi:hypothetical protein